MNRFALLLFLCVGLFASCKKSGGSDVTPVDPRNRVTGSYAINYSVRITFGRELNPETYSGTVTVSKSPDQASQIFLDFDLPSGKERQTAALNGSSYTVLDKKTEPIILNGTTFTGVYSAEGQFTDDNKFIYVGSAEDPPVKKVISMTGTKK